MNTAGPGKRSESLYRSVLVGIDGSPTAREAARKAFDLTLMLRASVHLAHVGDPILGAIALEETAAGSLGGTEVHSHTASGTPATTLLELAAAHDVGVIVVGNKGMAGARRLLDRFRTRSRTTRRPTC